MSSSGGYAAFVVGFAIMTDSMIYTVALPFLPDLFAGRLGLPERQISQYTALAFEVFAVTTLLTNLLVGFCTDASASKSRPFLLSILIMLASTLLFFLGTTPAMILVARAIQGASVTFTWVTGLAFLVAQVGESDLGTYVGWTTVGVAVGEIVGPIVGGPLYDYLGHWATFGAIEALVFIDILLRVFAKEKGSKIESETQTYPDMEPEAEQASDTDRLLQSSEANSINYNATNGETRDSTSQASVMKGLAWNWLGTVITLIAIFMVRGALEVAIPLYLTRQYSWTPTNISLVLLTLTAPAAFNPAIGKFTSRQGPRWWSTGGFVICGAAMISFANVVGSSQKSHILFVVHSAVVGIALAALVNSNQVAISVAAQRFGNATTHAKDADEELGPVLSWLSPNTMLSGVTTSWAAGILLGPAYSSVIPYTKDAGWAVFCYGLGGVCLAAALASSFLWRNW